MSEDVRHPTLLSIQTYLKRGQYPTPSQVWQWIRRRTPLNGYTYISDININIKPALNPHLRKPHPPLPQRPRRLWSRVYALLLQPLNLHHVRRPSPSSRILTFRPNRIPNLRCLARRSKRQKGVSRAVYPQRNIQTLSWGKECDSFSFWGCVAVYDEWGGDEGCFSYCWIFGYSLSCVRYWSKYSYKKQELTSQSSTSHPYTKNLTTKTCSSTPPISAHF